MSSYISEEFRQLVANRSKYLCEYCLIHEEDTFFQCQVDHIIKLNLSTPELITPLELFTEK